MILSAEYYIQRVGQSKDLDQFIRQPQEPILNEGIPIQIINATIGIEGIDNAINNLKKLKLEKNYNKICRENDSIRYYRVKNKSNSIELMIDFKDKREKAKEEYQKIQDIESVYEINDPKELPGYLFFMIFSNLFILMFFYLRFLFNKIFI